MWNFFRLENEHLNNCGNFRAVRDISVKPVNTGVKDELTIEQLMDDEHGPLPKRRMMNLLLLIDSKKVKDSSACVDNTNTDEGSLLNDANSHHNEATSTVENDSIRRDSYWSEGQRSRIRSAGSIVEETDGLVYNIGSVASVEKVLHHSDGCQAAGTDTPLQNNDDVVIESYVLVHNEHKKKPEKVLLEDGEKVGPDNIVLDMIEGSVASDDDTKETDL